MSKPITIRMTIDVVVTNQRALWKAARSSYTEASPGCSMDDDYGNPKITDAALEALVLSTSVEFDEAGVEIAGSRAEIV